MPCEVLLVNVKVMPCKSGDGDGSNNSSSSSSSSSRNNTIIIIMSKLVSGTNGFIAEKPFYQSVSQMSISV